MQVHILASGSTGNVTLFKFGNTRLLVDVGISTRRIENKLAFLGIKSEDLDGVLITHEHSDHIKGLDVFIRRYHLPVFAREATWEAIPCRDKLPDECCVIIDKEFCIGDVEIEAFSIPHDAADPVGFSFHYRQKKWVLATDMGMITDHILKALMGAELAVLESNHDREMLKNGPYPHFLKQRIMGRYGHLSNLDAASILERIAPQKQMQVFLAHLSQQNNSPTLAYNTVSQFLARKGCHPGEDIKLHLTHPDAIASYRG